MQSTAEGDGNVILQVGYLVTEQSVYWIQRRWENVNVLGVA